MLVPGKPRQLTGMGGSQQSNGSLHLFRKAGASIHKPRIIPD